MILQAHGWADFIFKVAIWLLILMVVPLPVVVLVDLEFHGVVAGCDRGHVPFELLNFTTLVQLSEANREQVSDNEADCNRCGHLDVLLVQDRFRLDALILGEDE